MRLQTLRSKIFSAFLAYSLLGVIIAGFAVQFFNQASHINAVAAEVDGLLVETLELYRFEQAFSSYDLIDPQFYQLGTSDNLRSHAASLQHSLDRLNRLSREKELTSLELDDRSLGTYLTACREELESYSLHFDRLVALSLDRGFKDFGLIGEMRTSAHALEENLGQISMVDLLLLRRHEKDYIIRKDPVYSSKLVAKANEIRGKLAGNKSASSHGLQMLADYQGDFERLVEIESQIGLNNQGGAFGKMRSSSNNIALLSAAISDGMGREIAALRSRQFNLFFVLVASGLTIALVMGWVLSRMITRPVRKVTQAIRETVESNFQKEIAMDDFTSKDEIGMLARDFETMLRALYAQLEEIGRNSESLSQKNEELKVLNSRLEASKEELQKINDVKNKVFSIISHDFRSPLHSLLGYLNLFEENAEVFTKDQLRHFSKDTKSKVRRLLDVLEDTLQWSMHDSGNLEFKPTWNDLAALSEEAIELYAPRAAEKGIQLKMEVGCGEVILGDKRMLQFMLRNLVSNAVKFSTNGTKVSLQCEKQGGRLLVRVVDQGVGMSPEQIRKVLNSGEFFSSTGTDRERGTGFGLALCKQFALAHGGSLLIESELGKGSSVQFDVPLKGEGQPEKETTERMDNLQNAV